MNLTQLVRVVSVATVCRWILIIDATWLSPTDAPKVNCTPTVAYIGDLNVAVGCIVRAKPPVTAMFWIIDDNGTSVSANGTSVSAGAYLSTNGTSVSEGDPVTDHWTIESVCKRAFSKLWKLGWNWKPRSRLELLMTKWKRTWLNPAKMHRLRWLRRVLVIK